MSNELMTQNVSMMPTSPTQGGGGAMAMVTSAREMAEVQSMVVMAKQFPRDVTSCIDRILNACTRPKLAERAVYAYARGGSEITGPSIRLAEVIAQNYGNLQYGVREIEQKNGVSTCEAYAWDMETNMKRSMVFQVPHIRHTRNGDKILTDPRDIYELVANQGARRVRACILGVVPGDIVEEAVHQCDVTLAAKVQLNPERIKALVDSFEKMGVKRAQLEAKVQRRIDTILPAQFLNLCKIYNSLKDGMSKPLDWFDPVEEEVKKGKAKKGLDAVAEALNIKSEEPEVVVTSEEK